jgi:hypothetical protein
MHINYTGIVHLIGLSHVHLAAASKVKYVVEIVGTFILVYAVCSAATVYSGPNKLVEIVGLDKLSMIGIGLVATFVVIAITYATAYRSGAQINPAVTIALLVTGKIRAKEAALTIACQILGAVEVPQHVVQGSVLDRHHHDVIEGLLTVEITDIHNY